MEACPCGKPLLRESRLRVAKFAQPSSNGPMKSVGLLIHCRTSLPRSTVQDHGEAHHWFRLSAEQGNADAQFSVGFLYYTGRGVPKDHAEAERWYRLAAEQGEVGAQLSLALMYSDQDDPEAIHWYKLAAEQGDDVAQYNLAVKLIKGDGVPQNMALAHTLFDLSAAQGNGDAQRHKEKLMALMTREQIAESQRLSRKWIGMRSQDGGPL